MAFCLPIALAEELKAAAKRGEIDIAKMYDMNSAERRALFTKYVDGETAKLINGGFEKAMVSNQKTALKNWAEKTFTGGEKSKVVQKDVFKKINELASDSLLTPKEEKAFLEDLVAQKLGITISPEEGKMIAEKAGKLQELQAKIPAFGDHTQARAEQIEYFKAKREMENYLESLTPSSNMKVATSTIARGNMLFRLGSILVNINSNNIEGAMGAIVRRSQERVVGGLNSDYGAKQSQFHLEVYNKTGYDLTRLTSLDSEKKVLGEDMVHSQGKGTIRAIGRWYEDKVFGLTQGTPDVIAASFAGNDRGNLMSTKMAYSEGLKGEEAKKRALEIFKDASQVEPKTKEGQQVRDSMIIDAERSTNTDKRFLAERALKIRNLLNVGDLRFGDLNVPFVKTTANSIQSALQTAGVTVPVEVPVRLLKMIKLVSSYGGGEGFSGFKQNAGNKEAWGEASEKAWRGFGETMVRAGIGLLAGWLLANAIKKEDYMGIYPTTEKERELMRLKNATPNSIRINGHWYSLDWFGPLAAPLIGQLTAKKYGNDLPSAAYYYLTGAGYQVLRTPGIDYATQALTGLAKVLTASAKNTYQQTIQDVGNYLVDFTASRSFPQVIADVALLTDNVVRDTSSREDILAPLKGKIPGFMENVPGFKDFNRGTLPEKKTVFGDTTATEGWGALILGGRFKTDTSTPLINELSRLSESGNLPSITDVSKTSIRAKQLKEQIGDEKFSAAMEWYTGQFKGKLTKLINTSTYRRSNDEEKAKQIDKVKADQFDLMLQRYHYRKPKK